MSPRSSSNHLWSIIQAGGDGTRLKSLIIRRQHRNGMHRRPTLSSPRNSSQ